MNRLGPAGCILSMAEITDAMEYVRTVMTDD
jgi:hypothetical protein